MTGAIETCQIDFDAATHTYTVAGKVLPSVTQILKVVGCLNTRWYTDDGRQRGEAVDILTELFDTDALDRAAAEANYPQFIGYLDAWIKFREETGFRPVTIQERMCSLDDGYAGTLDRTGAFGTGHPDAVLPDIKTGAREWWHPLQTAAYARCDNTCDWVRGCVYLRADGTYKWVEHTNPADEAAWLNAVAFYHYRKNQGAVNDE